MSIVSLQQKRDVMKFSNKSVAGIAAASVAAGFLSGAVLSAHTHFGQTGSGVITNSKLLPQVVPLPAPTAATVDQFWSCWNKAQDDRFKVDANEPPPTINEMDGVDSIASMPFARDRLGNLHGDQPVTSVAVDTLQNIGDDDQKNILTTIFLDSGKPLTIKDNKLSDRTTKMHEQSLKIVDSCIKPPAVG